MGLLRKLLRLFRPKEDERITRARRARAFAEEMGTRNADWLRQYPHRPVSARPGYAEDLQHLHALGEDQEAAQKSDGTRWAAIKARS